MRTMNRAASYLINRFVYLDRLHIMVLDREDVSPSEPENPLRLSSRIATLEDLEEMEREGGWGVRGKLEFHEQGDTCLLSYVDGELAGYTWAHSRGCPELLPDLTMSVPRQYLYSFAAFTLPAYRGLGLQAFRHRALLEHPRWKEKKGLLSLVAHTNYSSRRGQAKSGHRRIGDVWLIGSKTNFVAIVGKKPRRMGLRRIHPAAPEEAGPLLSGSASP